MKEKIVKYLECPFVTLTDSIIILTIMLFSCSFASTYLNTSVILSAIIVAILCTGVLMFHHFTFYKKKKNYFRGVLYAVTPLECLAVYLITPYSHKLIITLTILSAILVTIYIVCFEVISYKHKIKKRNALIGIQLILSICYIPALIYFTGLSILNIPVMTASASNISKHIVFNNYPIGVNEWNNLSYDEKFSHINKIICLEAAELGMETTPEVRVVLYKSFLNGQYSTSSDIIYINITKLDDPKQAISTALHELYHRHEYSITLNENVNVTGITPETVEKYKVEFELSNKLKLFSFRDYYTQQIEIDARNFESNYMKYVAI